MGNRITRVVAIPDKKRANNHSVFRETSTGRIALPSYQIDKNDRFIVIGEVWKAVVHVEGTQYLFVEPTQLESPEFIEITYSFETKKPPTPAIALYWKVDWWLCKSCKPDVVTSRAVYTPLLIAAKPESECFLTRDGFLKVWWKGINREIVIDGPTELLEYFVYQFERYKSSIEEKTPRRR